MDAPIDDNTKRTVQKIPLLATRAGPRDGENWTKRLKEEYLALIQVRHASRIALVMALVGRECARERYGHMAAACSS